MSYHGKQVKNIFSDARADIIAEFSENNKTICRNFNNEDFLFILTSYLHRHIQNNNFTVD